MHSNHDIFIQGIQQEKRLKLTFFSRKNLQNLIRQCAPLHYSKGQVEGDDLDCYYIWDFEATKGNHFLALFPSQIVTMELAEEAFNIGDFTVAAEKKTAGLTKDSPA